VLEEWESAGEAVPEFARELVTGVTAEREELDRVIGGHAEDWSVERMAAVDRAILRLAAYELHSRPDVPTAVAIDEAVEAAKELSTADSGRFVNGILGRIAREREGSAATESGDSSADSSGG
jgi:N utilization substance protein B